MLETNTLPRGESQCISIFMRKFGSHTQDRMLKAYGVNNPSLKKLVSYFRKQEEQNRFEPSLSFINVHACPSRP